MKKDPPKEEQAKHEQSVEVIQVKSEAQPITLRSQGLIDAHRTTVLSAELNGRVVKVAPKFKTGAIVAADEILLEIDAADYEAALSQSEASVADAKLALVNEQAKAEQAQRDWAKLAAGEKATDLVLRKPHIESASARLKAAEAAKVKAQRDLDRTKIRAPYSGVLKMKYTEQGALLSPGVRVAEIYATDYYEVRLPLSLDDYAFIDSQAKVSLRAKFGTTELKWPAVIQRTEAEIDRTSRTIHVVAELSGSEEALKPGLFVQAEVKGKTLENIIRVPRRAMLDENHLLIVDEASKLRTRTVSVLRSLDTDMLISSGLKDGERVIITALSAPIEGMSLKVVEVSSDEKNSIR
jgi:RND family efflux transporter MFP subunit